MTDTYTHAHTHIHIHTHAHTYTQICLSSTELAAVYVDGTRAVANPGYIPHACELVNLAEGEHDVKLMCGMYVCVYMHGRTYACKCM